MFNTYLYQPLLSILLFLTHTLAGNLGLGIIALTLLLRGALVPLTLPSLRSAQKLQSLKPELDNLKKRFDQDKVGLQKAQLELYKKHNINPAAGCLPNILQLVILIALYRVFIDSLNGGSLSLNTGFLWLDLTKSDQYFILPLIAGLSQLFLSLMLTPAIEHHPEQSKAKTADVQDMAETMQQQLLFIMPAMTAIIAVSFPSGLALYWTATTVFSLVQQYFVSGWGGLPRHFAKIRAKLIMKAS